MQAFIAKNWVNLRLEPQNKRNRITLWSKYDQKSFIEELFDRNSTMHDEKIKERRGGELESIRLGHIFWEIGQDPYVKMSRE